MRRIPGCNAVAESDGAMADQAKTAGAPGAATEQQRLALARELSCVIKPTMSDAEIAKCKWAWSVPPPSFELH